MQKPRRPFFSLRIPAVFARQPEPVTTTRSAPVELDLGQLRHVSGGPDLPKKIW